MNYNPSLLKIYLKTTTLLRSSVADPDLLDPYVFGPPGAGSEVGGTDPGSGTLLYQVKIVRKTLFLLFCDFLFFKNVVKYVPSKSNQQKTRNFFLSWKVTDRRAGSGTGSVS
jgi:hypothetical protein